MQFVVCRLVGLRYRPILVGAFCRRSTGFRRLCTLTLEIQIALCPIRRVHLTKGEGKRGDRCRIDVCRSVQ